MTEWHVRYGVRGVMIYWHVDLTRPATAREAFRLLEPNNSHKSRGGFADILPACGLREAAKMDTPQEAIRVDPNCGEGFAFTELTICQYRS
jgi:hypothetical protein